jgi:hypothetical protein
MGTSQKTHRFFAFLSGDTPANCYLMCNLFLPSRAKYAGYFLYYPNEYNLLRLNHFLYFQAS